MQPRVFEKSSETERYVPPPYRQRIMERGIFEAENIFIGASKKVEKIDLLGHSEIRVVEGE